MSWTRKEIFKYAVVAVFLTAFAILFAPFYSELLLAAIVAFAIEPFLGRWLQSRHLRWKVSIGLILIGMFVAVVLPISMVAYRAYRYFVKLSQSGVQNSELFQRLVELKSKILLYADQLTVKLGLEAQFDFSTSTEEIFGRVVSFLVKVSTDLASRAPDLTISVFVFCAALYYFLAEARSIKTVFMRQRLLTQTEADRLIKVLQNSSFGTVVSSLVIGVMQATIVMLGALVLGTGDLAVVWAVTFFCSFIPVIGAAPVALALGAFDLIMGDVGYAVGFVVVAVIAGTMDNLARPYLISSNEQDLHPVVSLLAIIGALLIFGMPGLFLGPVIAGVAIKVIPTLFGDGPLTEGAKDRPKKAT